MNLKKFALVIAAFTAGQAYTYIRTNQTADALASRDGKRPLVIKPDHWWDYRGLRMATDPNETKFHQVWL